MTDTTNQLHHISVAGLVLDEQGRFLLIKNIPVNEQPAKWSFPKGAVEQMPGSTWEILEKTLARSIFEQTGVEIADGPIPFTDQTFVGKDGFDTIVQFFICKHKYGVAQIQDPNKVAEIAWQAFAEFDAAEFEPLVYTVFEKATQFMEKLHTL